MQGRIDLETLQRMVIDGDIETVIAVLPDMYGRLVGKRFNARYFIDDVAIARRENPVRRDALDEDSEMTGERAGALEQSRGTGGELGIDRPGPARPEDRRLAETRRQDPEGGAGVAVALPEDVAGQAVRVRHHGPDAAVGIADVLRRDPEPMANP